ncbi:MAG: hypothetical protein AB7O80_21285, partial [Acetobacteraceae bacterium]
DASDWFRFYWKTESPGRELPIIGSHKTGYDTFSHTKGITDNRNIAEKSIYQRFVDLHETVYGVDMFVVRQMCGRA